MTVSANPGIRWLYCLAIISAVLPPEFYGAWIRSVTEGTTYAKTLFAGNFLLLPLFVYRVYLVARYPYTLDAHIPNGGIRTLRVLAVIAMLIGIVASVAIWLVNLGALTVIYDPVKATVASHSVILVLYVISSAALFGWLAFELSRLLGFEAGLLRERGS